MFGMGHLKNLFRNRFFGEIIIFLENGPQTLIFDFVSKSERTSSIASLQWLDAVDGLIPAMCRRYSVDLRLNSFCCWVNIIFPLSCSIQGRPPLKYSLVTRINIRLTLCRIRRGLHIIYCRSVECFMADILQKQPLNHLKPKLESQRCTPPREWPALGLVRKPTKW